MNAPFKIVFDLDAVIRNRYSGFYTFGKGLLQGMNKLESPPDMVLLYQNRYRRRAQEITESLGPWTAGRGVGFKFRWLQNIWNYIPYPDISCFTGDYQIFHSFHHLMPPLHGRSSILTVHDLRRYVMPRLYKKSKLGRFEYAVKRADHFIAVSESTKRDLMRFFNIPGEKIDVVYLACSAEPVQMTGDEKTKTKQILFSSRNITGIEDYFITLSSKDKRKNVEATVRAFKAASSNFKNKTGLIVIGRLPKGIDIQAENVFAPGEVDDIISWMACSRGLIFASLYEGFGLPILEGFSARVPVITSNRSSMAEIAKDAALLVDPENVRQLSEAIIAIENSADRSKGLVEAGRKRLQQFSWVSSAQKTTDIYKKVLALPST